MRLIDADALLKHKTDHDMISTHLIYNTPTIDAVPVIRCKDCKLWMRNPYRESSVFGLCFKHKDIAITSYESDWCSWAERKEEK